MQGRTSVVGSHRPLCEAALSLSSVGRCRRSLPLRPPKPSWDRTPAVPIGRRPKSAPPIAADPMHRPPNRRMLTEIGSRVSPTAANWRSCRLVTSDHSVRHLIPLPARKMNAILRAMSMMFVFSLATAGPLVPPLTVVGCTFPATLQGTFKRQNESHQPRFDDQGIREPLKYEDIYIGPSSAPYWGDCYDSIGDSYVLGLKKVGGTMCFRCFTIVAKAENILQVANQGEQYCYRTVETAKRTCFDSSKITPGDGIMLYRSDNVQYQYCPLDGRAQLEYSLGNHLHCPYPSKTPAQMSNCEVGYQLDVQLRGCTFPDMDMTMKCMGTWSAGDGQQKYFAVFNEQAGEYRCGMFADTRAINGRAVAALSNDSSCINLLNNSTDGYEMFTFYQEQTNAWPAATEECEFPKWLQGKYDTLSISGEVMSYYQHQDQASMMTVNARCVAAEGQRVRVYSKTHCGDTLGYHCLMFQPRSASVLEFKTSGAMQTDDDVNMCKDEKIFDQSSWTTVSAEGAVEEVVSCAHPGRFTTPTELRSNGGDCFNLTTDYIERRGADGCGRLISGGGAGAGWCGSVIDRRAADGAGAADARRKVRVVLTTRVEGCSASGRVRSSPEGQVVSSAAHPLLSSTCPPTGDDATSGADRFCASRPLGLRAVGRLVDDNNSPVVVALLPSQHYGSVSVSEAPTEERRRSSPSRASHIAAASHRWPPLSEPPLHLKRPPR
uniref:Uncharacterized protein n=1 Tax=Plectus sambesii TaxID=2011161 RepID=A0A914VLJ2_9BILA